MLKEAKNVNFFCLQAIRVSMKRNENLMKWRKRKTGNFISLLLDAKKLMQKKRIEAKIIEVNILIEQAKRMQNGSLHASFRFEAKKI